jgi:hypothetical protein
MENNTPHQLSGAFIVDVDRILALRGDRNIRDENTVLNDKPNAQVVSGVLALAGAGLTPVFMSIRSEGCRRDTERWLRQNIVSYSWCFPDAIELHMRATNDDRSIIDIIIDMFNTHIRPKYDVRLALDYKERTVEFWHYLHVTCVQVDPRPPLAPGQWIRTSRGPLS